MSIISGFYQDFTKFIRIFIRIMRILSGIYQGAIGINGWKAHS